MIPAPITELNLSQQFELTKVKKELEGKNYGKEITEMFVGLVRLNMIKDANIKQLVKYCAEKDMGMR